MPESPGASVDAWAVFRRVLPTSLTLAPIAMLLGVLAAQAHWSAFEVFLFSLLGFSGSGQFALMPLAAQDVGFLTLLLLAVSINSRYVPIAFVTASRLPSSPARRGFMAHILGDEAFVLEQGVHEPAHMLVVRLTIYGAWVLSSVAGVWMGGMIPLGLLDSRVNLGFPASMVLLVLCFGQLKVRVPSIRASGPRCVFEIALCVLAALAFYALLGRIWFWLPSIAFSTWRLWKAGA
jgi:Predicted branched-chain amino acid permease (azaleucine resistance)